MDLKYLVPLAFAGGIVAVKIADGTIQRMISGDEINTNVISDKGDNESTKDSQKKMVKSKENKQLK